MVQHVSIGIIAYRRDGKVDIFNNAVKQILGIRNLRNIQELKKRIKQDMPETLFKMRAGDKSLIKLFNNDQIYQLSVYATEFRMRGEDYTLISLQDIHSELEEKRNRKLAKADPGTDARNNEFHDTHFFAGLNR